VLERVAAQSGLGERWTICAVAAGVAPGTAEFLAGLAADSRIPTGDDEREGVISVPVVDVFEHLDGCDLLKIDIEGGEWEILADERFTAAGPPAVVLEFHGYGKPRKDIRGAVTELLEGHGYTVQHTKWDPVLVGQLWAYRA
jgi:FkbM family methyltransferase